jgi:hypothetical protein
MTREFVPSEWIHAYEAWARSRVRTGDGRRETTGQARLLIAFLAVWAIAFAIVVSHIYVTDRPDLRQPATGSISAAAADDASTSGHGW